MNVVHDDDSVFGTNGFGADHCMPARATKRFADYRKGLGRRWWLVLLLTCVIGGSGTVLTFWQPPVYRATARVLIEPPRAVVQEISEEKYARDRAENFFQTRTQLLASRQIAARVFHTLQLSEWDELSGIEDPIAELCDWLDIRPVKDSNLVEVSLEGRDAALVAKIVNGAVEEFVRFEQEGLQQFNHAGRQRVDAELRGLADLMKESQQSLARFQQQHPSFLADGESVESRRLAVLEEAKVGAELRLESARQALGRFEAMRQADIPWISEASQKQAAELQAAIRSAEQELAAQKGIIRPELYDNDVAIRRLRQQRDDVKASLKALFDQDAEFERQRLQQEVDFAQMDLARIGELTDKQRQAAFAQQDDRARIAALQADATRYQSQHDFIARKRLDLELNQGLVMPRIQFIDRAETPPLPVRPVKEIQIPVAWGLGFVAAVLAALWLEHVDDSVREPRQASESLDWPLLGVVPRLSRRQLRRARGMPLACAQPGSVLCEVFRSVRTGLLGAESRRELRSLVVTSARPGEGKSLVAANLAAACAAAGESVLLADLDLRKPALEESFALAPAALGLVQVLEGAAPWQKAVIESPIENLSLLPTGDVEGVSADVLGTREMHDLLELLVEHYDRVILDAPPILGLADARVVARFADGVLFVVKADSHNRQPLWRVRELFAQDQLQPVGIVFNGQRNRHEDLADYYPTNGRARKKRPTLHPEEQNA
jgi:capsular exopolysaccharide synthesis family protein